MALLAVGIAAVCALRGSGSTEAASAEEIVALYKGSVAFIEGSYLFRDKDSGEPLRAESWRGAVLAEEESSEGPIQEFPFSGTGFVAGAGGQILTNRHIAEPWWADAAAQKLIAAGFRPEYRRLVAYFPGRGQEFPLKPAAVSSTADVAVLKAAPEADLPTPIPVEMESPWIAEGAPVVVIGYSLGLEAMLTKAGRKQLDRIPDLDNLDESRIVRELAERNLVRPFVTQGHLSNVTEERVVYDAATTSGASGSPVLDRRGRVIAIHSAVIAQFSEVGLGVPIRHGVALLAR